MGGNVLQSPGASPWAGNKQLASVGDVAGSAVDTFDAAARLEAQGYGDAAARKLGYSHVFEMAERLMMQDLPPAISATGVRFRILFSAAVGRLLVLFSGVVLCIVSLPPNASTKLMFLAGASGWIWTQVLSAGIWYGLGQKKPELAASIGLSSMPVMLVVATLVSVGVNSPVPLIWALWGMAASVLLILRPGWGLSAIAVASACMVAVVAWDSPKAGMVLTSVLITFAFLNAVFILRKEGGKMITPDRGTLWAQTMGFLQAGGQLVVFLVLLHVMGSQAFLAIAVAGLVAAALADPVLEIVHAGVRRVTNHTTSWRAGRVQAALWGIGGVGVVMGLTALVAVVIRSWLTVDEPTHGVILATMLVAGITAGIGLLLRTGAAMGATILALGAAGLAGGTEALSTVFFTNTTLLLTGFAAISVLAAVGIAARRMSSPVSW